MEVEKADLGDVVAIFGFIYQNASDDCPAQMDVNGDDRVQIDDPLALLMYLFLQGPPPVPPFPKCGVGSDANLPCLKFECP